ncbi:MAG: hypothetical protein LPK45_04190 [Bacteroidota bacterium]|nr:hypothetical protein [Bacteroidota bacterium]MDX5430253.1 hypothetical protein [Bacteroidota bacterium]MDX5469014.1 hypothetical protein [Bacteroidota bacterium]
MKTKIIMLFTALLFFGSWSQNASAQDNTDTSKQLVLVVTKGNVQRTGYILSDDGREILLQTESIGKIYILKSDIKSITPIKKDQPVEIPVDNEEVRQLSPFNTRYYFTTNAHPMKKGDYYVMTHLWGPEVHFGVNDRFSAGIMSTWFASPFIGAFKYSIPTKNPKLNFGLGTLIGTSGYINQFSGFGGLHWGMATVGDKLNNVTLSLGYGYFNPGNGTFSRRVPGTYAVGEEIPVEQYRKQYTAPVVGLGGILQVGRKASVILDAMVFFGDQSVSSTQSNSIYSGNTLVGIQVTETPSKGTFFYFMPGMRFQSAPNKAFQVALAGVTVFPEEGEAFSFPIPMCSWFVKF